ncbi:hypothetical protein HMPREF9075_02698 [Capnocytophaga sp. oral taxon 332 str. F0381]|nr:hypothetical protein HMPREF9075_02698 [Capnocytophaga sp. oral taxon 332 str. F0381]
MSYCYNLYSIFFRIFLFSLCFYLQRYKIILKSESKIHNFTS